MYLKNLTTIRAMLAVALLLLSSCSGDPPSGPTAPPSGPAAPPPPPPASGEAQSLFLVSGDGQNGRTLAPVGEPLTVRALDAQGGGVAGISVSFAVTVGGGEFSQSSEITDADGLASVELTLGPALGSNVVTASVSGLEPVTFTADATVLVIDVSNFAFVAPDGSDAVLVAVGDTIEWVNRDNIPHTVTANLAPHGGVNLFDSGILALGETFRFVPGETGVFEYFCQVHPAAMFGATITVQ